MATSASSGAAAMKTETRDASIRALRRREEAILRRFKSGDSPLEAHKELHRIRAELVRFKVATAGPSGGIIVSRNGSLAPVATDVSLAQIKDACHCHILWPAWLPAGLGPMSSCIIHFQSTAGYALHASSSSNERSVSIMGGPSAFYERWRDTREVVLESDSIDPGMALWVVQLDRSSRIHVKVEDLTLFVQVWALGQDDAVAVVRQLT